MTKRRGGIIPFEVWASGAEGHILACVSCALISERFYRRHGRYPRSYTRVYKTPEWATRHAEEKGHRIEPVDYFHSRDFEREYVTDLVMMT